MERHTPARRASERLRDDLDAIRGDGVGFSIMVGAGETYVAAFALALGMSAVGGGLVASLPLLAGALLQLASPYGVRRAGSHRRWVVACAATQAACYLLFAVAAARGSFPHAAVYALAAAAWGAGMAAGPPWNRWVGRLVPERLRARFWAERTRAAHVAVLLGLLAGGAVLHVWKPAVAALLPFAVLFLVAAGGRAYSAWCLSRQTDLAVAGRDVGLVHLLRRLSGRGHARLLGFALATTFAVQIAGPYFTPYMILELRLPYASYMLLVAASYVAKIAALPLLGRVARRHGARPLLAAAAFGIAPLPALWLGPPTLAWLVAINLMSGVVWAAYELALFLLLFETIDERERVAALTAYNVAHAVATVGGALLGGAVLAAVGAHARGFAVVFALSSLVRVASLLALRGLPGAASQAAMLAWRAMQLRPAIGFMSRPLVAALPRRAWDLADQPEPAVAAGAANASAAGDSPRDTTTAAARSPVTLSVVRHMSRKRSTPRMSPIPSGGIPTMPRMSATTGIEPAGTPAVPMPPSTQTSTTSPCSRIPSGTP